MTIAMADDQFWAIIESTTTGQQNGDFREETLRNRLAELPLAEVKAFHITFDHMMSRSYAWNLWGAAWVIHGGCSDDGFEYFRRWLVSRGRNTFEAALADAESLADVEVGAGVDGSFDFESIYYVAVEVYEAATGIDVRDEIDRESKDFERGPSGAQFDESEQVQARLYPRLWALYGASPLPR